MDSNESDDTFPPPPGDIASGFFKIIISSPTGESVSLSVSSGFDSTLLRSITIFCLDASSGRRFHCGLRPDANDSFVCEDGESTSSPLVNDL